MVLLLHKVQGFIVECRKELRVTNLCPTSFYETTQFILNIHTDRPQQTM